MHAFDYLFIGVMCLASFILGAYAAEQSVKRDAVKNNHAEYYLDENFNRNFRWKEVK